MAGDKQFGGVKRQRRKTLHQMGVAAKIQYIF